MKSKQDEGLNAEGMCYFVGQASARTRSFDSEACNLWRDPFTGTVKIWRVGYHPEAESAPMSMCFTPTALQQLLETVGCLPPESGAKGFGPKDRMGFAVVEFDEQGSRTAGGAVYRPDVLWGEKRRQYHLNQPEESMFLWDGDLHSHPGDFGQPSGKSGPGLGDLGYVEEVFAQNEWMQWFFIPIITGAGTGRVTIHPWVCRRDMVHSPMVADLVVCEIDSFPLREFNPLWLAAVEKESSDDEAAPAAVEDAAADLAVPDQESTAGIVGDKIIGLVPRIGTGELSSRNVQFLREEYTKRMRGLVSDDFHKKTVLTIGLGAGSYTVEKLARLCPARLKNCDFDNVELSNLARTAYSLEDVGSLKVDALEQRIRKVNPLVQVVSYPHSITNMTKTTLDDVLSGVDLIVGGTDQFEAQALINELAVRKKIPAIFIGIHAGGEGGRVIWYIPGETGCYRCLARERYDAAEAMVPLEMLNLNGTVGSLVDCQFIDMVALKVAVAILDRDSDSKYGRFYDHIRGRNDVVVRCHPDYAWGSTLWDALLGDLPKHPKDYARELRDEAFLAMDTVWLKGRRDPDCPVCRRKRATANRALTAYRSNQLY